MRNLTMPNVHVETRLLESEYELLKDFKEKNGLKTDYQGLKELVKALDIPEFHEEVKTEETLSSENVKTEVKPIDRTNLENWVKDLGFEQPQNETQVTASYRRIGVQTGQSIERLWDILFWLQEQTRTNLNVPQINTISPLLKQITDEFKKITNDGFSLGLSTALKQSKE